MLAERFVAFLHRHRWLLLGAWTAHTFVLHYVFIGFISWDGLNYRVPPAIELLQHGSFGLEKFYNQWAFHGLVPFVELLQVPFLYLFKLRGLIIGGPLVVFPLCVVAVYACVRELTSDERAGTFGALAYAAMPMINQQPYSGYIDYVVSGLLAFFIYAVARARVDLRERRTARAAIRLVIATLLFTMSRSQGVYVVGAVLPVIAYALFCTRDGRRVRVAYRRELLIVAAIVLVGCVPALAIQVVKYLRHGTPTYPVQFSLLGLKTDAGIPMEHYFRYAGLASGDPGEMARAFVHGWIGEAKWPLGGFFDSRTLGGGVLLPIAVVLLPWFVRDSSRVERWLVPTCIALSVLARDYVHPRYAYTLVLALVMIVGRAAPALASSRRGQPVFWIVVPLLLLHFTRPEIDIAQMLSRRYVSPHLNVTGSEHFLPGPWTMHPFPDLHARIVIVEPSDEGFVVQMYGAQLTNEIVTSVPATSLGVACAGLQRFVDEDPAVLFVDTRDVTRACARECAFTDRKQRCRAYRIRPGAAPSSMDPG